MNPSLTKYQSDWMCGLYSRRSACMYYQVHLPVCPDVCLCISLPFTSTLGGGEVKEYSIIIQPNLKYHLGLLGILGFTLLVTHLQWWHGLWHSPLWLKFYLFTYILTISRLIILIFWLVKNKRTWVLKNFFFCVWREMTVPWKIIEIIVEGNNSHCETLF